MTAITWLPDFGWVLVGLFIWCMGFIQGKRHGRQEERTLENFRQAMKASEAWNKQIREDRERNRAQCEQKRGYPHFVRRGIDFGRP